MILTVLGGSAHSTPVLVRCLTQTFSDEPVTVRLVGRNRQRLTAVARASRLLAAFSSVAIEEHDWANWPAAVRQSDAVLIQVRPGNYEGRAFDETFPLEFDIPGDEGLGPGGLSAAWRSWPLLRELIAGIRLNAPGKPVLLLTSPGSLLVRLAGQDVVALCELPWTTLCSICGSSDQARRATFDYYGVNHIGWLYNVRVDGEELPLTAGATFPPQALVRRARAWPLKYLRLHYCPADVLREQKRAPAARAHELAHIAEQAFAVFTHGSLNEIISVLRARKAEWYGDAVVPLLAAYRGYETSMPLFLTANSKHDTRERCYRAVRGRLIVEEPSADPPREVADTVARFVQYENAAALAVELCSEELAVEALSLHPWITSGEQAVRIARRLITQNKEMSYASA